MINGKTRLVGVIGDPIEHSFSPMIHNAAFRALDINWCYVPMKVESEHLDLSIEGLRAVGFHGINITAPHKQNILKNVQMLDEEAASVGAVNTLVFKDSNGETGAVKGFNTDVFGFRQSLKNSGFEFKKNRKAIVIGAGGAAKAVILGLTKERVDEIIILNRTAARGKNTCEDMTRAISFPGKILSETLNNTTLLEHAHDASLLINATTVGTYPNNDQSIWPQKEPIPKDLFIFDLVYNPMEPSLMKQARISGAQCSNGFEMLILQAARSFEYWTGMKAPMDVMRNAIRKTMEERYAQISNSG